MQQTKTMIKILHKLGIDTLDIYTHRAICLRILSIYDYAKRIRRDEGKTIELRRKVLNGILCAFVATVCVFGSGCGNSNPAVNSSVNVNSQNAQNFFSLGKKYYDDGEYEKAVDAYKKAIEINPQYAEAYNNLGNRYYYLQDFANAVDAYRKATELDPQNAITYNDLGTAYANLNDLESAADAFRRATEINPQDDISYRNLALALRILKRYDEAIQSINRAIELNPQDENYRSVRDEIINLRDGR